MRENNILKLLENIGLSQTEARVYLANLKLGPATAIALGQKTRLTRQMIYMVMPSLLEKGLVRIINQEGKRYYQALPPKVLMERASSIVEDLDRALPQLQSMAVENSAIPEITVYENPLAMRNWYEHFMEEAKKGEQLLVWSSGEEENWFENDRRFYEKFLKFSERKIKTFVLLPNTAEAKKYQEVVGKPSTKYRFVDNLWFRGEKWIWRDEICFLSMKVNASNMIVVKSNALAELEKASFWSIWKALN